MAAPKNKTFFCTEGCPDPFLTKQSMLRHVEKYCPIVKERLARCENERRQARMEQLRAENCVGEQLLEKFVALEDAFAHFKASMEEYKASVRKDIKALQELVANPAIV
jgi:hypothetical protein